MASSGILSARGNTRTLRQLMNLDNATREGIHDSFQSMRRDLVEEAKRLILKPPKTGRLYRIQGRKRRHRASAPGESPSNLTGTLRRSIVAQERGGDKLYFGSALEYAPYLESGTRFIAPRPYLSKAIKNEERNIRAHMERQLENSLMSGRLR